MASSETSAHTQATDREREREEKNVFCSFQLKKHSGAHSANRSETTKTENIAHSHSQITFFALIKLGKSEWTAKWQRERERGRERDAQANKCNCWSRKYKCVCHTVVAFAPAQSPFRSLRLLSSWMRERKQRRNERKNYGRKPHWASSTVCWARDADADHNLR